MRKVILTDVDNCVLQFDEQWCRHLRESGAFDFPHNAYLNGFYSLREAAGVTLDVELELIQEFIFSDKFFNLPPVTGAPEAFKALYSAGWSFVAITACPHGDGFEGRRKANLEASLGVPFDAVHITGLGGCKKEILQTYPSSVWFEDNLDNAIAGYEIGHRSFLRLHGEKPSQVAVDLPFAKFRQWSEVLEAIM